MMFKNFIILLPIFIFAFSSKGAQGEVVIVVNPNSKLLEADVSKVKKIFLGKLKYTDSGEKIQPIDLKLGGKIRSEFYEKIVNKSNSQLKAYWSIQIFTGRGVPPKEAQSQEEIKKLISNNVDAIGYLDSKNIDSRVKVLLTLP